MPKLTSTALRLLTLFVSFVLAGGAQLRAEGPPGTAIVLFSPGDRTVEGDAPVYSFHTVRVTAPANHTTPNFVPEAAWELVGKPEDSTESTAEILTWVSFVVLPDSASTPASWTATKSFLNRDVVEPWLANVESLFGPAPTSLSFSSPLQQRTVGIIFDGPEGAEAGRYAFKLRLTGWVGEGTTVANNGTDINVRVLEPIGTNNPPTVGISRPSELQQFPYIFGGSPVEVAFEVTGAATETSPVTALAATVTEGPNDVTLALELDGLNTAFTSGTFARSYDTAGIYTLNVTATNEHGSASTSTDFEVIEVVPKPTISITPQSGSSPYSYTRGVE
jgi:hypothetical protein